MKHPATQNLYAYWHWLRAGRSAPERADIDPAAIRGILADTFILEVETPGMQAMPRLPVRLSGTRVNALFDGEVKGRCLRTLWRREDRHALDLLVATVLDDTQPIVAGVTGAPAGHMPLDLELVLLPLRHHGKTHARLLGALSPAAIPSWLGLLSIEPLTLKTYRMIADRDEAGRSSRPEIGRPTGTHGRPAPTRRGHFLIYEGGRRGLDGNNDRGVR